MKKIIQAVFEHASEVQPHECCGLVVLRKGRKHYVRCTNASSDMMRRFVIAPEEYAAIEDTGEIVMIAHSHCFELPKPSESDMVGIEQSGLPWLIVNYPNGTHTITEPSGFKAPLIGRQFCKRSVDCYALVKDYYEQELGISLPEYERPEVWHEVGRSILLENFAEFGFEQIKFEDLQPNDCLLMQVGAGVPNHCAVYIGNNTILHHVDGRLSSRDIYGEFWRNATTTCLRYTGDVK